MEDTTVSLTRKVHPQIEHDFRAWTRQCISNDWLNFIFGAGAAILSTLAAGTVAVGASRAHFDFQPTVYFAAVSALCTYANTVFNFGKRTEKYHSAKTDLRQAIVRYQSDPTLSEAWLADAYAKAAERLR
jgi:hypothetical protein